MPERQALRRNLPVPLLVKFRRCSSLGQCGYPILWVVALDYGPPFYKKCPVLFKNWCNLVKQSNTSYPVHDQDLCAKWTKANPRRLYVPYVPSSHSLSTRALHTIVDGYALHCRRCKVIVVVKQRSHSARRMERRHVSDDVYIVGRKQPASDFFRAVLLSVRSLTM